MKKVKKLRENNFFKTKFIQICRWLGYEIIDQNSFEVPTLNKTLNQSLGVPGKKSISIPLGQIKITRNVKSLIVYFRSCAKVHLWNQNKQRIFGETKSEYSLRSLKSICLSKFKFGETADKVIFLASRFSILKNLFDLETLVLLLNSF